MTPTSPSLETLQTPVKPYANDEGIKNNAERDLEVVLAESDNVLVVKQGGDLIVTETVDEDAYVAAREYTSPTKGGDDSAVPFPAISAASGSQNTPTRDSPQSSSSTAPSTTTPTRSRSNSRFSLHKAVLVRNSRRALLDQNDEDEVYQAVSPEPVKAQLSPENAEDEDGVESYPDVEVELQDLDADIEEGISSTPSSSVRRLDSGEDEENLFNPPRSASRGDQADEDDQYEPDEDENENEEEGDVSGEQPRGEDMEEHEETEEVGEEERGRSRSRSLGIRASIGAIGQALVAPFSRRWSQGPKTEPEDVKEPSPEPGDDHSQPEDAQEAEESFDQPDPENDVPNTMGDTLEDIAVEADASLEASEDADLSMQPEYDGIEPGNSSVDIDDSLAIGPVDAHTADAEDGEVDMEESSPELDISASLDDGEAPSNTPVAAHREPGSPEASSSLKHIRSPLQPLPALAPPKPVQESNPTSSFSRSFFTPQPPQRTFASNRASLGPFNAASPSRFMSNPPTSQARRKRFTNFGLSDQILNSTVADDDEDVQKALALAMDTEPHPEVKSEDDEKATPVSSIRSLVYIYKSN